MISSTDVSSRAIVSSAVVVGDRIGAVTAIGLVRRSVPIRVVDAPSRPTDRARAAVLAARTEGLMNSTGVPGEVLAAGRPVRGMENRIGDQTVAHLDSPLANSPDPCSVALPRNEAQRILFSRPYALGVHVGYDRTLTALGQGAAGARELGFRHLHTHLDAPTAAGS
jgi:2-polyprenyl-6-methoxyphenol hydroxylase-like FAD-dependent oxidoreductase